MTTGTLSDHFGAANVKSLQINICGPHSVISSTLYCKLIFFHNKLIFFWSLVILWVLTLTVFL